MVTACKQRKPGATRESYRAQAVRRVMIPKGDGKTRPLGIPTIRDRVAQMAAVIVLEPIFEADFPDEQYGYRPGRSAHEALGAIYGRLKQGYTEGVDADLSGYFDTIPHPELMQSLARRISDGAMLALLKMWLEMAVETTDERGNKQRTTENKDSGKGTPQGAPISPLLSNLYMRRFVMGWKKLIGKGHIVAYADDFVILCKNGVEQARAEMEKLMKRLKLKVNPVKTKIARVPEESFDFLGYTMGRCYRPTNGTAYIGMKPSKKSIAKICQVISEQTERRTQWMSVEEKVKQLNTRLRGWGNYFKLGPVSRAYAIVDNHARHRLRQWLKGKHKGRGTRHCVMHRHDKLGLARLCTTTKTFPWAKPPPI